MPPVSQSQRRWAFWTAEGKNPKASPAVGKEFEGPGIRGLPDRVGKKHRVKPGQVKRRGH